MFFAEWLGGISLGSKCFPTQPAPWLPFRDTEILSKIREIHYVDREGKTFENPEFAMRIVGDATNYFAADLCHRIHMSDVEDKKLTVLLPSPENAVFISVAAILNKNQINTRNVHIFFLSEYANENHEVAPVGNRYAKSTDFMTYFYNRLDPELRMPESNLHFITTENIGDYSAMIDDCGNGGADVAYTSVGWTCRIAGIDPVDCYQTESLDEFLEMGSAIVTPTEESIAEDSLHGMFGCAGDIANVPPKIATIGPRDIAHARDHVEIQNKIHYGAPCLWQRMSSRQMLFAPIMPAIPASILRLFKGIAYVNSEIAVDLHYPEDIDPLEEQSF